MEMPDTASVDSRLGTTISRLHRMPLKNSPFHSLRARECLDVKPIMIKGWSQHPELLRTSPAAITHLRRKWLPLLCGRGRLNVDTTLLQPWN